MSIYGHLLTENNNQDEELEEGVGSVLGTIALVALAPFFIAKLFDLILSLALNFNKNKKNKIIEKNPETTKSIIEFAKASQKQIYSLIPSKYKKFVKAKSISLSDKNFSGKEYIFVDLFNIDLLKQQDYYKISAEHIYDINKDDERFKGMSKEDAIKEIESDVNYFEDGWESIYKSESEILNAIKKSNKERYDAYKAIEECIVKLNKSISNKINSKGIDFIISSIGQAANTDFTENPKIQLRIKYIDYSKIELPKEK